MKDSSTLCPATFNESGATFPVPSSGRACRLAILSLVMFTFVCSPVLPSSFGQTSDETAGLNHPQRAPREIHKDLKAHMKNMSQEEDLNLQIGAAVDLCNLHRELVTDPRFQSNDRLRGFRAQAATRLKRYTRYVKTEMKRIEREEEEEEADSAAGETQSPVNEQSGSSESEEADGTEEAFYHSMNDSMLSMGSVGGPLNVLNHLGGSYGGPACDHGPELVELIRTTIEPEFWQTAGGEGRIYYYRPSLALVVSANSEVHDRLEDFLYLLK